MALVPPERGSRATSTTRRELMAIVYSASASASARSDGSGRRSSLESEDGVNCDRPTRKEFRPKVGSVLLEEYELQLGILRKVVIKSDHCSVVSDGKSS